MHHVRDTSIDDFIARWERAFGEHLTPNEARIVASKVLTLYRNMLRTREEGGEGDEVRKAA